MQGLCPRASPRLGCGVLGAGGWGKAATLPSLCRMPQRFCSSAELLGATEEQPMAGPSHMHFESVLESWARLLQIIEVQQSLLRQLGHLCAPLQHDSLSWSPRSGKSSCSGLEAEIHWAVGGFPPSIRHQRRWQQAPSSRLVCL